MAEILWYNKDGDVCDNGFYDAHGHYYPEREFGRVEGGDLDYLLEDDDYFDDDRDLPEDDFLDLMAEYEDLVWESQ